MPRQARRAFSLIELLVVIAIIAVLTGLLLAGVQRVRHSGNLIKCANNLRQIGMGIEAYRNATDGTYPDAAQLPSVTPDRKSLFEVIKEYVEFNQRVFQCPNDPKYFVKEGLSYEYQAGRLAGKSFTEITRDGSRNSSDTMVANDFESFHGGQRVILYADGHVK